MHRFPSPRKDSRASNNRANTTLRFEYDRGLSILVIRVVLGVYGSYDIRGRKRRAIWKDGSCSQALEKSIEKKLGRAQGHSEVATQLLQGVAHVSWPSSLTKATLTSVFILCKVFASSFSLHVSRSFIVAPDIIPPAEKTKGMKLPLVRGLAWIARLSICSRYSVACWTMWRGREVPSAGLVVVLVALLPRRV